MAIRGAASLLLFVMVMAASDVSSASPWKLSHFRGRIGPAGVHGRKFLFKSTGETRPARILAEKIEPEPKNTYSSRVLAGQLQVGQKISDPAGVDIHDSNYAPRRPRQPIVNPCPPPSNVPVDPQQPIVTYSPPPPSNLPVDPIVLYSPPPPGMLMNFHTWTGNAHTDYDPVTIHPPVDGDYPPLTTMDFHTRNSKIGNAHTNYDPVTTHPPVDADYPPSSTMDSHTWNSKIGNAHTDYNPVTTHPPVDHDYPPPTTMNFDTWNSKVGNVHADYVPAGPSRPILGPDYPEPGV